MTNTNPTRLGLFFAASLLLPILILIACQKKEIETRQDAAPEKPIVPITDTSPPSKKAFDPNRGLDITRIFDTIGPLLTGDYNGDGETDTARAAHVRSVGILDSAPVNKTVIDQTSYSEELCGGWGIYLQLGRNGQSDSSVKPIYFCGQQARIADSSWVGSIQLDTLPFPELKTVVGNQVKDVISLFSQAGITVYLYFTGHDFKIFEPDEEP